MSHTSQVEGPHHPSALEAFPAAAGVADVDHGRAPGAGIGGDQRWQAPQEPAVPVKGEAFRKVEWARESRCLPTGQKPASLRCTAASLRRPEPGQRSAGCSALMESYMCSTACSGSDKPALTAPMSLHCQQDCQL